MANAHLLDVTVTAEFLSGSPISRVVTESKGYMAEPVHGAFYVFLAPSIFLFGYCSISCFQKALFTLRRKRVLVPVREEDRPLFKKFCAQLARNNCRRFWYLPPLLVVLLVGLNVRRELDKRGRPEIAQGGIESNGYAQSDFFTKWKGEFDNRGSSDKLKKLRVLRQWRVLEEEMLGVLSDSSSGGLCNEWRTKGAIAASGAFGAGKITAEDVNYVIAMDAGLVKFSVKTSGGTVTERQSWFWMFFWSMLLLEGTFHAFAIWIALKYIYWLTICYRLLPGGEGLFGWKLEADCEDNKEQFGLTDLHRTYHLIVWAIMIAIFIVIVQSRGVSQVSGSRFDSTTTSITLCLVVVALFVTIVPVFFNSKKLKGMRARAMARKSTEIDLAKKCGDEDGVRLLKDESDLISKQKTWPAGDYRIWLPLLICAAVAFPVLADLLPFAALKDLEGIADFYEGIVQDSVERFR